MFKEPVINVYIPYEPEKRLGEAYNRIIKESAYEWNLLLDWDVTILNPNWYDICQQVILYLERESKCIGLIGAVTNYLSKHITPYHTGDSCQISSGCPKNNDIDLHIKYAHYLHNKHRGIIQKVCFPQPLGGFLC